MSDTTPEAKEWYMKTVKALWVGSGRELKEMGISNKTHIFDNYVYVIRNNKIQEVTYHDTINEMYERFLWFEEYYKNSDIMFCEMGVCRGYKEKPQLYINENTLGINYYHADCIDKNEKKWSEWAHTSFEKTSEKQYLTQTSHWGYD